MTLAFYDTVRPREASQRERTMPIASPDIASDPSLDLVEHERTYRDFVWFARCAAFAVPFFMAFVLYWTT